MPALSPTMKQGNIAKWKVKSGDSFCAGDVLLEIETDKATMDVEAQEDGVMVKITQEDGSNAVQVGSRIAVIAEPGDDVASIEMPPDETPVPASAPKKASPPPSPEPMAESHKTASSDVSKNPPPPQTYPLFPAVKHLMKQKGIDESEIRQITPTGPKGRLLKGDVLAYLGVFNQSKTNSNKAEFEKLSHLDLSNVKVAAPKEPPEKVEKTEPRHAPVPVPTRPAVEKLQVSLPISLAPALETRRRLRKALGVDMSLSTFIARATDLANDDLPMPSNYQPSADELFDQILGQGGASKRSRGCYLPQVSDLAFSEVNLPSPTPTRPADIIDTLCGSCRKPSPKQRKEAAPPASTGTNVFALSVAKPEEKRAKLFLQRLKKALENEPGMLVL